MMIKLSPREAELLANLLHAHRSVPEIAVIEAGIRSRLAANPIPIDAPRSPGWVPAGAVIAPHHRASHWRQPIPGIDE